MSPRVIGRALTLARHAAAAHIAGYLALSVLGGLAPLAVAWLGKLVIDRLAGPVRWLDMVGLTVALAGAGVAAAVVPPAVRYVRAESDRRVNLLAVEHLYASVDRFVGLRRFEDPAFLDRLQIARASGVNSPGMVVDGGLGVLRSLLTVVGFAGALLVLGPGVTAAVLLSAAPALAAEIALSRRRAAVVAEVGQAERREMFYSTLLTSPQAAKELRLFGAGPYLWRRMLAEIRTIDGAHRRIDRRELVLQGGLAVLGAAVAGALLLWTVRAAAAGALTIGDVALVVAAVGSVQAALAGLVTEIVAVHQAALLFEHYVRVVDAGPDLPVRRTPLPVAPLRRGVEFRDVWFRYAPDQPWVLRGVDLVLPADGCTAVVGLNGAGKTTLVKLLCRLYDPTRGAVLWDGVDLRDLDPAQLRRRIRAVFQDAVPYDLTARENIAIGDLTALEHPGRIEAAARRAGVHDVLDRLPNGYDTLLTRLFFSEDDRADPSTGVVLSGGQWQRLAIARGLLLEQPDLLVLDEPSSALDAEAEHEVHTRLREHRQGRASLLISHRLGVLREADLIVVLADGRIAERGTHDELLARDDAYARLFHLQASGYRTALPEQVA
ncbi:ABC transporter ATP-binding protein [Dactylosporangium aurantiacum]|uniref:ABC transporter ATP-binding protein n=1 Tax=Dactylosporangium aurantiacum TaxID=35754 RepID=A0A9Q9MG51_9ACTN|nr:ABC transporter ATP-binding protein [Dactylosporangium aurantiacum]MDG6107215.1 ABC transporter ATP-binding protein [Dactylosporangium aurantiacum]UWZ51251.1 ABC transporter ATP-binding protein [Dactylosporangium aurantiacum]